MLSDRVVDALFAPIRNAHAFRPPRPEIRRAKYLVASKRIEELDEHLTECVARGERLRDRQLVGWATSMRAAREAEGRR
ncbi:MAG TPA: hypothetical protein VHZ74_10575 [Bryobacteraceae bacterium]|jgi:proline racemase|nr:hypothetical protein [Bryobacteraceae bacterium]